MPDVIKLLEASGWYFHRMGKGDHMIYRHPARRGPIVVAGGGKLNRDVPTGTHNALVGLADGAYIELIAFYEPHPENRWWQFLQAGGGLVGGFPFLAKPVVLAEVLACVNQHVGE